MLANLVGCFAFQPNNQTRAFEYPWAYESLALRPGMRVLEIGGGLSGFQFVLDRAGCQVVNVDPGAAARGVGWTVTPDSIATLNKRFGTHVDLRNCFIEEAHLEEGTFDRVVSISTIEHIPDQDIATLLQQVRRLLKPGGLFVITLDLFLDVHPFTDQMTNRYGKNVSVHWLVEQSGLELAYGDKSELYGYDEFDHERIERERSHFWVGTGYPVMIQTVVLRKPDNAS